ncbi:hypothetical protein U1872_12740 [Sphingomonas sp. RB3P16]|uniref:hypothetical protein n=1 Tax=Parasphingomonas frigoris TaxID=3096163 RepID=UPI002FC71A6C
MGITGTADGSGADGWRDLGAPAMLVIGEAAMDSCAEQAIHAAGGRSLGRVAWQDAGARLAQQGSVRVILAELGGATDACVAPILPLLDAMARVGDVRIVASCGFEQIDLLAANLTAAGVELLCAPSPGERFTALRLAALSSGSAVLESGRDAEAMRLQRLHEEVARIAETLTRLTRTEQDPRGDGRAVAEPGLSYRLPTPEPAAPVVTAREIRDMIRARRVRDQYFGAGLFEDPAWDMLLDLFAAELERAQVSVSSLCIAAAVAPTTALRWIARMTDAGLFERQPDPFDRRRAFMGLSRRASHGMRSYIGAIRRLRPLGV